MNISIFSLVYSGEELQMGSVPAPALPYTGITPTKYMPSTVAKKEFLNGSLDCEKHQNFIIRCRRRIYFKLPMWLV